VLVSRRSSYTSDLTAFLFGRLLTVSAGQVLRTAVVAALVLASLAALYKELQLRAFDPTAAAAMGYRVAVLDLALNTAIALVVVAAAQAVGTILVIALLIVPAAAGRLLSDRMWMIMVAGVVVAGLAGYLGLAVSYTASVVYGLRLASGATVVLWLVTLYLLALASVPARRWVASRTPPGEAPVELV
jgi:manganese/iron transport system permease protein